MRLVGFQNPKARFILLLSFHGLWGILLGWSIASYGLGTSRDSAEYLFTSLNLTKHLGFISFAGDRYTLWPPLYPLLLSLIQQISGRNPLQSASVLQWITFAWIALLVSWLFLKVFPDRFLFAFIGSATAGTGVALTMLFQGVGSDYLFLALILSFAYFSDKYISHNHIGSLWMMTLLSALAMLQRYLGVSVLATGFLVVYFHSRMDFRGRLRRSAIYGLSVLPLVAWVLYISVGALERGEASSLADNLYWFSFSSLNWFFSFSALSDHPFRTTVGLWGIWFLAAVCVLVILTLRRRYSQTTNTEIPVLLFGLMYTILLVVLATLTSFNRLDGRFVAPVYIPFILLLTVSLETLTYALRSKNGLGENVAVMGLGSLLIVLLGLSIARSVEVIHIHRGESWGYTSKEWYDNQALRYWLEHLPEEDALAFSNYPAGIAIHSWRETLASPRRVYTLDESAADLFEEGKTSYLIWIEPNTYTHVYDVEELRQIAFVETLYEDKDGGVYKLHPLK
jgi:hypothetical protein